ncbi:MAG: STAS domain-containing protein [Planctomycetales bacterium]|nr:STAS domain-containing protein [bacterium]UNM09860.1 MAG: STAS domain-containing protein [Planctomycetales bacterium]
MNYSYEAAGGSLLFRISGDLTMFNVSRLVEGITRAWGENSARQVVLYGDDVSLIDSAAFGMLIKAHAGLLEDGGRICFIGLRPHILSALQQLHLDETLRVYDSLAEASEDSLPLRPLNGGRGQRAIEL